MSLTNDLNDSINSLEAAMNGHNISAEESKKNIAENIVGVYLFGKFLGTAFQITEDGWMLTAEHLAFSLVGHWQMLEYSLMGEGITHEKCREKYLTTIRDKFKIVRRDGVEHPFDITIEACNDRHDIGLLKAIIYEEPKPVKFRVNRDYPQQGGPIHLYTMDHGEFVEKSGFVLEPIRGLNLIDLKSATYLGVGTTIQVQNGNSGGAYVLSDGSYTGTSCFRFTPPDIGGAPPNPRTEIRSHGPSTSKVLELVNLVIEETLRIYSD